MVQHHKNIFVVSVRWEAVIEQVSKFGPRNAQPPERATLAK
jgi:hypothetical protein